MCKWLGDSSNISWCKTLKKKQKKRKSLWVLLAICFFHTVDKNPLALFSFRASRFVLRSLRTEGELATVSVYIVTKWWTNCNNTHLKNKEKEKKKCTSSTAVQGDATVCFKMCCEYRGTRNDFLTSNLPGGRDFKQLRRSFQHTDQIWAYRMVTITEKMLWFSEMLITLECRFQR